jgi:hypothetical protein
MGAINKTNSKNTSRLFLVFTILLVCILTSRNLSNCPSYETVPPQSSKEMPVVTASASASDPLPQTKPSNASTDHYKEDELSFIVTIQETVFPRPKEPLVTPNFFEILEKKKNCLPTDSMCFQCLTNRTGSNCERCREACPCYCEALCNAENVKPKFVSKRLTITPPKASRNPDRLIPRIVHQTYFEEVTPGNNYPQLSRFTQTFRYSGWDYRFYNDEEGASFLSTHFPPEVREAFDTLQPGAFKADLFRYCVLFIHGGLYADIDVMLESNLDISIQPDVGFMVPNDSVGIVLCCVALHVE